MKKIIFDCDNTFGVPGCDVDDGLALLYLLGNSQAEILGITCCYGNSDLETVYANTGRMLKEIGREEIPVWKGEAGPGQAISPGARFLAEQAASHRGELSVLATGSLTNLWAAWQMDSEFFQNVKEIALMGGITEPLLAGEGKKEIQELNFSCDPKASLEVLTRGRAVAIATGNNCLEAYFGGEEFSRRLKGNINGAGDYIYEQTGYWFGHAREHYRLDGFFNWDVVAAVCLMEPQLFERWETSLQLSEQDLQKGYLREGEPGNGRAALPRIKDIELFKEEVYGCWLSAKVNWEGRKP